MHINYVIFSLQVVLIIGISGACRNNELLQLTVNNIEKHSDKLLLVKLKNTKTNLDRSFVVREEYVTIVEKYQNLRPANIKTDRFFIQYHNNKCSRQPMGVNKIGAIPREIATFLKLEEPQLYTGHCFRRTSATLLADSGADLTTLKRHGGWKSNTVAEGYIEDSIENKSKICKRIVETISLNSTSDPWSHPRPSTSNDAQCTYTESRSESPTFTVVPSQSATETETLTPDNQTQLNATITLPNKSVTFNLQNCSNFTFNF